MAVTTILFLSGISFSIQKGNVIESSLMLASVPLVVSFVRIENFPRFPSTDKKKNAVLRAPAPAQLRRLSDFPPLVPSSDVHRRSPLSRLSSDGDQRSSTLTPRRVAVVRFPFALSLCVVLTDSMSVVIVSGRLDAISKAVSQTFGAGVEFVMAA